MRRIILASESPRRKELLKNISIDAAVEPAAVDESLFGHLDAREMARELSRQKAAAVAGRYQNAVIIAADTVGILGSEVLGKPHTPAQAKKMLQSLSGTSHTVVTAYTINDTSTGKTVTETVETTVYFKKLDAGEIEAYVKTGEPLDKAGGYAIQGLGSLLVEKISGDYYNVVGLPLSKLAESLKSFGIDVWKLQNR